MNERNYLSRFFFIDNINRRKWKIGYGISNMCCYNRPYDPQEQLTVAMETQCKLRIQRLVEEGKYDLVGSYTLDYECSNIPSPLRKKQILERRFSST